MAWDDPDELDRRTIYEAVLQRANDLGTPVFNKPGPFMFILDYHGNQLTYEESVGRELGRATMAFYEPDPDNADEENVLRIRRSDANPRMFRVSGRGDFDAEGVAADVVQTFLRHVTKRRAVRFPKQP